MRLVANRGYAATTEFLLALIVACGPAAAETRRALLVGIDHYKQPATASASPAAAVGTIKRVPVRGESKRKPFSDLEGAASDMRQVKVMLVSRFGFREQDIRTLENQEATADAILSAIQTHLIDSARPGDVSLFYYAGHGSRMRNLGTKEHSGYDSTIVAADSWRGTPDIRDKELARVFRQAVRKGIVLTVIADSCHSGSLLRGQWRAREVGEDGRYVDDPPDRDASGKQLPDPEDEGALVLSAAQDYQPAAEITTDTGFHGAFTWALLQVLRSSPPNERADRLFQRVRALVQSEVPLQEPVLAGKDRGSKGLFGQETDSTNAVTVAVRKVTGDTVELQGGSVLGLAPKCELVRIGADAKDGPVRVAITQVTGLGSSMARIVSGNAGSVREGDLFQLDRWVLPDSEVLRVYVPRTPPPLAQVLTAARAVAELKLPGWVDDPTVAAPDFVVRWEGSEWVLAPNGAVGAVVKLGAGLDVSVLRAKLRGSPAARVFFMAPPPAEVAAGIRLGRGTSLQAIALEDSLLKAQYALAGRYKDGGLEFAWVRPRGSEEDEARIAEEARKRGLAPSEPTMPLRTRWFALSGDAAATGGLAARLMEYAARIARLQAWRQLEPPQNGAPFPYELAFQEISSKRFVTQGEMHKGEKYKLYLVAEPARLRRLEQGDGVPRRKVQVFVIDSDGRGQPVFPSSSQGSVENEFPVLRPGETKAPERIALSNRDSDLEVSDPLGTDLYVMIASEERLNPEMFSFEGIRGAQGGTRGGDSALARLLFQVGSGTRGEPEPAPLYWSIQKRVIRSVGK